MIRKKNIAILGGGFISNSLRDLFITEKKFFIKQFRKKDLDLSKKKARKKLLYLSKKFDVLILIAAKAPVKNFDMFDYNLKILNNFCETLKKEKLNHLIYISSDAVYKDTKNKINESSIKNPNSLHGLMHLYREKILKVFFKKNLCIVRPTLIYGENDPHNGYGPNSFIRNAQRNREIKIFGNGEERRDHIHIDNVTHIIKNIIMKKYVGELNIVSGKIITFKQIAEKVINNYSNNSKIVKIARKGPMPHLGLRQFDNKKIFKFINRKKIINLENWIEIKKNYSL